jgi:hypothetical protein
MIEQAKEYIKIVNRLKRKGHANLLASYGQKHARRVLLLERANRYLCAAMKLHNFFENDAAWALSLGAARGDAWYWWCVDACELNANVLWTTAQRLREEATSL